MNVGYCSVSDSDPDAKIDWDKLDSFGAETETEFFRHVRLPQPLIIRMDGRQRIVAVSMD